MNNMSLNAAARAACRVACTLPVMLAGSMALAAQQADPALPAAPGAPTGAYMQAGAAPLPTPPGGAASALSTASNLSISWSGYFEALAILCFALALLWVLLWLVKRHGKVGFLSGASPTLRIESRLALGPKKWVIVVRYMDRRLVLGLTDERISLLTEIPPENGPVEKNAASSTAGTGPAPNASAGQPLNAGFATSGKKDDPVTDDLFASLLRGGKENESPAK